MPGKLVKAFDFLKADVKGLKETVAKLEKVHPIVKEGKPGGNNWVVIGNAVDIPLSTSSDVVIFFDLLNLQVAPGTKFRNRFAQSSTGNDSGDLRVGVPSAALQAAGVPDAPSSQATFYKIDQ